MGGDGLVGPLFETKKAKGRISFQLFTGSVFVGLCLIWVYRATRILRGEVAEGRWAWLGVFVAELWFGIYWILTLSVRWKPIYRRTFKDGLSHRYEDQLPGVDIFVCTADPRIEPPTLVISTVLSVMAYNYPPEKLSVYLSNDGGSELTFYALLEASRFAKSWIPFCKKFNVEPRSPAAYFSGKSNHQGDNLHSDEWLAMQKLYKDMENQINTIVKLGRIPKDVKKQHRGFAEWNLGTTSRDHQAIVQIVIDGRDPNALDIEGSALPTLVYVAREKRSQYHHNFKAGAMNVLIRASSEISNGPIILNVDCDMYSNNSEAVREALCLFMDEEKGHNIAFVQFPQNFDNITKNDIYSNSLRLFCVDFSGLDGCGGPLYVGSGCFHRRRSLCGQKYNKDYREEWKRGNGRNGDESVSILEENAKGLATCTYEQNTQWGKEVGLKYGCPVEDVITGLSIQCRGWKSVYLNPKRKAFLGVAPMTLAQTLVQHKRWSEGDFQIFLSKYCPFLYGHGKIKLGLQLCYSSYCLWAPNALPTLYYCIIPSLCLLNGISLFPRISDIWFIPFAYVITTTYAYSLGEWLWNGGTLKSWWNERRMWMFKRTTSYLFAFIDTILKQLGINESAFIITAKVADDDVSERYEQEIMEFGSSFMMFNILAMLAIFNLLCLVGGVKRMVVDEGTGALDDLFFQLLLSGVLVIINIPIYQGLFLRKDTGRMPTSVAFTSIALAILACLIPLH